VAQIVEYLPRKCEVLSSNPSTTKIKFCAVGMAGKETPRETVYLARCYNLDLECPPKAYVLKSLPSACGAIGRC
jgi:hypothetical protein